MKNNLNNKTISLPILIKERGVKRFDEERLIRNFIKSTGLNSTAKILDIGCGFGRKMEWLAEDGFSPCGVDINLETVKTVSKKGFRCMTPDEFTSTEDIYDLMLMAHVVEHFLPDDLLKFMDTYLNRLKTGGYLVIATPLEWSNFYGDFDHVHIYHPQSFVRISNKETQCQYHLQHCLRLVSFGLRRRRWDTPDYEDYFSKFTEPDFLWRLSRAFRRRLSKLIFNFSGGSVGGITTGWVGIFQKEA